MKSVNKKCYLNEFLPSYRQVFRNCKPIYEPFQDRVQHRILYFPMSSCSLDEKEFVSLAAAAKCAGDTRAYFSGFLTFESLDSVPPWSDEEPAHWEFFLDDYETYCHEIGERFNLELYEGAIYSPRGAWGLMFSENELFVLGGSSKFIDVFQTALPDADIAVDGLLDLWQRLLTSNKVLGSWIPKLLTHLYGYEFSNRKLDEYGLTERCKD